MEFGPSKHTIHGLSALYFHTGTVFGSSGLGFAKLSIPTLGPDKEHASRYPLAALAVYGFLQRIFLNEGISRYFSVDPVGPGPIPKGPKDPNMVYVGILYWE